MRTLCNWGSSVTVSGYSWVRRNWVRRNLGAAITDTPNRQQLDAPKNSCGYKKGPATTGCANKWILGVHASTPGCDTYRCGPTRCGNSTTGFA
jgi:hypothetical protein